MAEAFIVGAVRTAVGKNRGRLAPVRPDDLAALVLEELIARTAVDPREVEDASINSASRG
jgi:acetyl-CoA C-acetyltransferase